MDQLPDNTPDFYSLFYHNHRVLSSGNLTGMVQFQCSLPWSAIKLPTGKFFRWLVVNKVFINYTKFKTSTLVPCGFLHGAHPGFLCHDEAELELCQSLHISPDKLPFQLSSRTISIPIFDGKPERFDFQAVVVEAKDAAQLREHFYSLADPLQACNVFPYTQMMPSISCMIK